MASRLMIAARHIISRVAFLFNENFMDNTSFPVYQLGISRFV
jgi:hypothetical protein